MNPDLHESLASVLPPALAERVGFASAAAPRPEGEFVLYWMRTALRLHENPALDAALCLSRELDQPVFVLHALSERTPWASDRVHTFVLEAAREVAEEAAERGIPYAFHLEREGERQPVLRQLAERAGVVLTEHLPVPPLRDWTEALGRRVAVPVLAVDTSCVVPMPLGPERPERAFAFKRGTEALRRQRLARPWEEQPNPSSASLPPDLPFEPLALSEVCIEELVALCAIDHAVPPVPDTPGGRRAGYARWERFKEQGLAAYSKRRNDATRRDGVSRLSAYLHFGMVSPFRIARDAQAAKAEKFLDELLIWRELAHHWCHATADLHTLAALPAWAQQSLDDHAGDERPEVYDLETLARARTGNDLWDAAQKSLLLHGELHNNLRMTWGKALLAWRPDPQASLEALIELNHRYALDGRDPSSYGGLLWCLGLFDRPFDPPSPIRGSVRGRSTAGHAARMDLEVYARRVGQPAADRPPEVVVVGAGIAGLAAARTLQDQGLQVRVLERARRPGGRMAARRVAGALVSHGPQSFEAHGADFARAVATWCETGLAEELGPQAERRVRFSRGGVVASEPKGGAPRYRCAPTMNALAAHLAQDLRVVAEAEVVEVQREGDWWSLRDAEGRELDRARALVLATGAPFAARQLREHSLELSAELRAVEMVPVFAVIVELEGQAAFDAATFDEGPLALASRQSPALGVSGEASAKSWWVLHSTPECALEALTEGERSAFAEGRSPPRGAEELEARDARLGQELTAAFLGRAGAANALVGPSQGVPPRCEPQLVHRWGLGLVGRAAFSDGRAAGFDPAQLVAFAGDACLGRGAHRGVEDAWTSGVAAAGRLLGHLARRDGASRPSEQQGTLFG